MRIARIFFCITLLSAAVRSVAAPLGEGMRMPELTLPDQHDVDGSVSADVRCVLFSRDMGAAKVVQETLGDNPGSLLEPAHALVVSDISRMPILITKLFALPAMRKRPYRMLLDREGTATAAVPTMKGKVTVLRLNGLVIERVEYVDTPEALRTQLQQAAAAINLPTGQ